MLQKDRKISKDLQNRVVGYYGYLFMQKKWQSNDDFFELLPRVLQVDYCYVANRHVFKQVATLPLHILEPILFV